MINVLSHIGNSRFVAVTGRSIAAAVLGLMLLTILCPLQAEAQNIAVGTASGQPGATVNVTVNFSPGSTGVATLQFDLGFSALLTHSSTATGAAAAAAGKSASASTIGGGIRILIFGLNQNAIGAGAVAVVSLNIAAGATPGSVPITISNIVASDSLGGNVAASGSAGSVTVTAPPDTTPPVLSSISSSGITSSSATVSWSTNEASNSVVEYGTTTGYGSTASSGSMVISHSLQLSSLSAGTLYHYRVKSQDAAGNLATSGDYTFTTAGPPDTTPPVLSGISASGITHSAATISWSTNEASNSVVEYGTTAGYGSTASSGSMVTSHSLQLSSLSGSTLYHYRVKSQDAAGNLATSGDYTFTTPATPDTTPPVLSGISASGITYSEATISWSTNEASHSVVEYGTTIGYGSTASSGSMVTSHSLQLSSLSGGTLYHYRVKSQDAAGNLATSGDHTFTTLTPPDTTPPVLSGISATGIAESSATISWLTDEASLSIVEFGTTTGYGRTAFSGTMDTSHSLQLNNLSAGILYHYRVKSQDAAGNMATSGDYTFTTVAAPDTTPPVLSEIITSGITQAGATISWNTDEAADGQVDYGTSAAYGNTKAVVTMGTSHVLQLTNLAADTLYHFRVKSRDAAGNLAVSGDYTFTTSATADDSPPVLSEIAASGITHSAATVTWSTNEPANSVVEYGTTTGYGMTASSGAMVASHALGLSGLSAGTHYHYRVKSQDAAGNLAASDDSTFTTTAAPDTTLPVLSGIAASGITHSAATISWLTDEAANSQVDYGTTTGYGSTASSGAMVTSHSLQLGGLTPNTLYHYRVKSQDAAGNLAVSEDFTFTTAVAADTTPPTILDVSSFPSSTSAVIRWTTNEAADSQVEYGLTIAYGNATILDPQNRTSHGQTIYSLQPDTLYHYRVKSRDAEGNLSVSPDYTFSTTGQAFPRTLYYPRLSTGSDAPPGSLAQEFVGLGIANLDPQTATVRFTAYNAAGEVVTGAGITNPVTRELASGRQLPVVDVDLFGTNLRESAAAGWVKIESSVEKLIGFFLMFNGTLTELDGADFTYTPLTSFLFTEIRRDGFTKISIANPNAEPAVLDFILIGADGITRATASREVPANGSLSEDLFSGLFPGAIPEASAYVRVTSTKSVLPIELVGTEASDFASLYARNAVTGAPRLYCPQYVVGGGYASSISIVNVDSTSGFVTMRLFGDNGTQIGTTRTMNIEPLGKVLVTGPSYFDAQGPDPLLMKQGYVEITGDGINLAGSVVFGDSLMNVFSAALPLSAGTDQSVVYGHISSDDLYYTGLAIVNPGPNEANVTVNIIDADGTPAHTASLTIPAGCRIARTLTEIFPALIGQQRTSGYFTVNSDAGVASFAVFGTHGLSLLSAIPPQIVR